MTIPRIARADLTAATVAKLHWQRCERENAASLRQSAHLVTVLGSNIEQGTIFVVECRADRSDTRRYCALFDTCHHDTTDNDYESFDDGDETLCPDGGRHIMFNANVDDYLMPGWHKDTRRCRFAHYCDLTEPIAELDLKRGVYFVEVASEDWQAGEVNLAVIATVGEPVTPGAYAMRARAVTHDRLRFGLESDLNEILQAELTEDVVDYDPEECAITIDIDPAVRELVRYLGGGPLSDLSALPLEASRPTITIDTGDLL
jgi:hypothetical protein